MKNILIYSSLLFFTNGIHALFKEYYFYSITFFLLLLTSLVVHSSKDLDIFQLKLSGKDDPKYTIAYILDKIAIATIVVYGGYLFIKKLVTKNFTFQYEDISKQWKMYLSAFIIPITFLTTCVLYVYGYYTNSYCFHEDCEYANEYHAFLHAISSIGHHLIILL